MYSLLLPVSEYAAPARALDVSGLPPALSIIGTTEPFYAETCRYFERLRSAGVACTLAEFEGAYHAFDMPKFNNTLQICRHIPFGHLQNTFFRQF